MHYRLSASSLYDHSLILPIFYPISRLIPCQTCSALRNLVTQTPALKYVLALATRGLCDGPPSPVTPASRLELVKAYDEAWRTFSWSRHLTLDLPYPHQAPYVSGDTLVLPVHDPEMKGVIRSFIMQSIPSPLRGVPGRQWRIDFDFFVKLFVMDATQDLLVVLPRHDTKKSVSSLSIRLPHVYRLTRSYSIFLFTLSAGQPHPLSANGGVLYLEQSRRPSLGNSKHEVYGEFFGMVTVSRDALDDRLFIWNWKTGIMHVKMALYFCEHT